MSEMADIIVIGAGISGTAAAYALAEKRRVVVLEMEDRPGYHSTGRSAALYTPNYGPEPVRRICRMAGAFLNQPPAGFADHPLLSPRGVLMFAEDDPISQRDFDLQLAGSPADFPALEISLAEALNMAPLVRPDLPKRAAIEPGVHDMDVAAIHQGFLRGLKARGGQLALNSRVVGIDRAAGIWTVRTENGESHSAPILVNAAGAWADRVAVLAGAKPVGLQPKLRTAILVDAPPALCPPTMPAVEFLGDFRYFKPDSGRLMASPGDETPSEPADVWPEDMVVAELAEWLEQRTLLSITRIAHKWAGLRTFVPDECPVVGFDPEREGFFWLAGQGGFGIMMSAPLGEATASLIETGRLPDSFAARGIDEALLSPRRAGLA